MKIWQCAIDDPRFANINPAQWHWYAEMLAKERKSDNDRIISSLEYLASFWDPRAVEQARSSRRQAEIHSFPDDAEFEERIASESYKNNPIVRSIIEARKAQDANYSDNNDISEENLRKRKIKLPTDLRNLVDDISK